MGTLHRRELIITMEEADYTPKFAPFFGMAGICFAMTFGCIGAAYGTAKSGIGIAGDMGVRSYMQQSRIFVGMVLILIFGEVLGLYGLIVALILNTKSRG